MSTTIFRDRDDADRHREWIKDQRTSFGGLGWWLGKEGSTSADIPHLSFHSIALYFESGEEPLDFHVTCAEYGYTADQIRGRMNAGKTGKWVANEILTRPVLVVGEAWGRF